MPSDITSFAELLQYFNQNWKETDYKRKPLIFKDNIIIKVGKEGEKVSLNELVATLRYSPSVYRKIFETYREWSKKPPYVKLGYLRILYTEELREKEREKKNI